MYFYYARDGKPIWDTSVGKSPIKSIEVSFADAAIMAIDDVVKLNTLNLYDLEEKGRASVVNSQEFRTGNATAAKFGMDHHNEGLFFASVGNNVQMWDAQADTQLHEYQTHTKKVNDFILSTDFFLTGSNDKTVKLFDCRAQICVGTYTMDSPVTSIAWSDAEDVICAGNADGSIHVFDIHHFDDSRPITVLTPNDTSNMELTSMDVSPKGHNIVAGYQNGTVLSWNLNNGRSTVVKDTNNTSVIDTKFSPDGRFLAASHSGGESTLWAPPSEE